MKADAVFEGGGVKGIGLVGALKVAEDRGYTWENVAGTSAGAIVASLAAAGYRAGEIRKLLLGLDLRRLKDTIPVGKVPIAGPALSLGMYLGLYKGDYFEGWLRGILKAKGVRTFGDLTRDNYRHDAQRRYGLQVIAADISRGRMLVLPQDISEFGQNPDRLDIASAVRMSISIPLFYRPVFWQYRDQEGKRAVSCIVDGGILSNFPVWLFDAPGRPSWPTFGFRLVEGEQIVERSQRVGGPISLVTAIFNTMAEAHDRKHISEVDFARTICIPTLGVRSTDFDLSKKHQEELYQSGVKAAEKFFRTWNFRLYLSRYRSERLSL